MNALNTATIATAIAAHESTVRNYAPYYGLRRLSDDQLTLCVGDDLPNSWQDDDYSDPRELDGTCTIGIAYASSDELEEGVERAIKRMAPYAHGENTRFALVVGTAYEDGWDEGEWIIRNAEIIALY